MTAGWGPALRDVDVVDDVMTHSLNDTRAQVILASSIGENSMSSVDICGDGRLLCDIDAISRMMKIICNVSMIVLTQNEDFGGYGPGWYQTRVIANILFLRNEQRLYKVLYEIKE